MKDWIMNGDALLKKRDREVDDCPYLKASSFITYMKGLSTELASYTSMLRQDSKARVNLAVYCIKPLTLLELVGLARQISTKH